jgi:hypothetical protein
MSLWSTAIISRRPELRAAFGPMLSFPTASPTHSEAGRRVLGIAPEQHPQIRNAMLDNCGSRCERKLQIYLGGAGAAYIVSSQRLPAVS